MKRSIFLMMCLALVPAGLVAEEYRDLDTAVASIRRGLERGETAPILAGVSDQVMLQFSGLMQDSGFFSRDQASFFLTELFEKAKPERLEIVSARKVSAQGQYHITAAWTIRGPETREVFVTLQSRDDQWRVTSIRSSTDR